MQQENNGSNTHSGPWSRRILGLGPSTCLSQGSSNWIRRFNSIVIDKKFHVFITFLIPPVVELVLLVTSFRATTGEGSSMLGPVFESKFRVLRINESISAVWSRLESK